MSDLNDTINGLLRGSYDLHVHAFPDGAIRNIPRRMNAIQTAEEAHKAGMGGLALKAHEFCTAPLVATIAPQFPGLDLLGGIALNKTVGGLNPDVVEAAVRLGTRMVWMPTFHAHRYSAEHQGQPGIPILDEVGRLLPAVMSILEVIKAGDVVLNTGHLGPEEIKALVPEARRRGIRTMVTHGTFTMPVEELQAIAATGAFVEHVLVLALLGDRLRETAERIRAFGVAQSVISTDFGQAINPPPVEGMRMFIAHLLRLGFREQEVEVMCKVNPRRLVR